MLPVNAASKTTKVPRKEKQITCFPVGSKKRRVQNNQEELGFHCTLSKPRSHEKNN
jgi:hypothetical protein